jgi:hypothetical protein
VVVAERPRYVAREGSFKRSVSFPPGQIDGVLYEHVKTTTPMSEGRAEARDSAIPKLPSPAPGASERAVPGPTLVPRFEKH